MCNTSKDWYPYDREVVQNNSRFLNKGICAPCSIPAPLHFVREPWMQRLTDRKMHIWSLAFNHPCIWEYEVSHLEDNRFDSFFKINYCFMVEYRFTSAEERCDRCPSILCSFTILCFLFNTSRVKNGCKGVREIRGSISIFKICGYHSTLLFENPKNLLHTNQLGEHPHHQYYFPLEWVL